MKTKLLILICLFVTISSFCQEKRIPCFYNRIIISNKNKAYLVDENNKRVSKDYDSIKCYETLLICYKKRKNTVLDFKKLTPKIKNVRAIILRVYFF